MENVWKTGRIFWNNLNSGNPTESPRTSTESSHDQCFPGTEVFDLDLQVVQCPAQVKVEEPFSLELQATATG